MANEAVFRSSVICLAVVILGVGIYTHYSLKKMMATYVLGMVGLCGILLPDWDYFDRPISHWSSPITTTSLNINKIHSTTAPAPSSSSTTRFKYLYPMRVVMYAIIYSYGLYKWWMFISN